MTQQERRTVERQIGWRERMLQTQGTMMEAVERTELRSEIAKRRAALKAAAIKA